MRNKGIWLLGILVVLLAAVLTVGELMGPVTGAQQSPDDSGQVLLDAMFDRIGVTRWGGGAGLV